MSRIDQLKSAFEVIHLMPLEREDADAILDRGAGAGGALTERDIDDLLAPLGAT